MPALNSTAGYTLSVRDWFRTRRHQRGAQRAPQIVVGKHVDGPRASNVDFFGPRLQLPRRSPATGLSTIRPAVLGESARERIADGDSVVAGSDVIGRKSVPSAANKIRLAQIECER